MAEKPKNMLYTILLVLGGIAIALMTLFASLGTAFAIPKGDIGTILKNIVVLCVVITPFWGILCMIGYINSWVFDGRAIRFLWVPLTLVPIGLLFFVEMVATRLFK